MTDLATAAQQVTQCDPEITIKLPYSTWYVVLVYLGLGAYRDVAATVEKLNAQIGPQLSDHHAKLLAEAELARRLAGEQQPQSSTSESEPPETKAVH